MAAESSSMSSLMQMIFDVIVAWLTIAFFGVYIQSAIVKKELANPVVVFFDVFVVASLMVYFVVAWPVVVLASVLLDGGERRK